MTETRKSLKGALIALSVVLVLVFCVQGCKDKDEPAPQQPAAESKDQSGDDANEHPSGTEHPSGAEHPAAAIKDAAQTVEAKFAVAGEQTTCPVMAGNPIDKDLFVEHGGKKVYFCCKSCIAVFQADPEKYVAKLPQFQE